MKPLKLGFVDYFKGMDEFFIYALSNKFEIVRDDANPDYLIFADETFGEENKKFNNRNVVKIFYTGENRRPWNYDAHYAISFDHIADLGRHYRLPLYVLDHWIMTNKLGMDTIYDRIPLRTADDYDKKDGFCCFISGNGGSQVRNDLFNKLNEYKRVDSYGPLFNNMGYVLPRGDEAAKNKMQILPKYRFNLCAENSSWPGYVTEKLMHAFYGNTVPIYWGSPTVELDFNPIAMLNRADWFNDNNFLDQVIKLDQTKTTYCSKYLQPIFNTSYFHSEMFGKYPPSMWDKTCFADWFKRVVYKGVLS